MTVWKSERLGLMMIAASVMAIMATIGLVFKYQLVNEEAQVRAQGSGLVQLLSEISYEQLVPEGRQGALNLMYRSQGRTDLAYAVITDLSGNSLSEVSFPGVIIPPASLSKTPDKWIGERYLVLGGTTREALEFFAPLLNGQELIGQVRLGYFKPGLGVNVSEIPFFASLALCIFLLTAVYYLMMRREMQPLKTMVVAIETELNKQSKAGTALQLDGDARACMRGFGEFVKFNQRRMMELEAQRSEAVAHNKVLSYRCGRTERVLDSLPDGIILLDDMGVACFANSKLKMLVGIDPVEVLGHPVKEWCSDPQIFSFISRHIHPKVSGNFHEVLEVKPSGSISRDLLLHVRPLYLSEDSDSRFGFLIVVQDKTAEVLAKSSCMEFVSHVAHELKSPLNVLAMYSEELQRGSEVEEALQVESANVIHDEVERLGTLINNLLSLTMIEMGSMNVERQRVKLRDLVADAFDAVSRLGRENGLKFKLDLPKEISPVAVDKNLLRIALNNLLTNAIKYNHEDGTVTMSVEELDEVVRITVQDTGLGIAKEDQAHIFDKFFRSEEKDIRQRSGHGLGLSLVRDIVNLHNGSIRVNS